MFIIKSVSICAMSFGKVDVNDILSKLKEKFSFIIDEKSSDVNKKVLVLRATICRENEAQEFVKCYGQLDHSAFVVHFYNPEPTRLVFQKSWICQHSSRRKSDNSKRDANCTSQVKIKIKKLNRHTKRNDPFLTLNPPLPCVITLNFDHNHHTNAADALRMLRVTNKVKEQFHEYFNDGMSASTAHAFHEGFIALENNSELPANASVNPTMNQVRLISAVEKM